MTAKMRAATVFFAMSIIVLGLAAHAHAGWMFQEKNGDTTFFSDGKMKGYFENEGMILDGKTEGLVLFSDATKTYAQGTVDELCSELKAVQEKMLGAMTPEMRKMIQQNQESTDSSPDVSVKKTGSGGTIAGFDTDKYEVFVSGELYEELWITTASSMTRELRPLLKVTEKFEMCVESMMGGKGPESAQQYKEIMSKGVVLKSVRYEMGAPETETDVVKVAEKSIPADEFKIPDGYQKTTYSEMMGSME